MSTDVFYYIKDDVLYKGIENDGPRFLRKGPERVTFPLCSVEEARTKYPDQLSRAMKSGEKNALR